MQPWIWIIIASIVAVIATLPNIFGLIEFLKKVFERNASTKFKIGSFSVSIGQRGVGVDVELYRPKLVEAVEDTTKKEIASIESARDAEIERLKSELESQDENQKRAKKDFDQQIKKVEEDADKKIKQIENEKDEFLKNLEIESIQTENLKGSKGYFRLSKFHAWFSFGFSILACSVGLVLISIAAHHAIAEEKYELMIAPGIGAALANFIAATVFWVHSKSAQQLNRYYDSLHEIEVFLSSTKIIEKIAKVENRDAAYAKVIEELYNIQKIKAAIPEKHVPPEKFRDKIESKSADNPKDKEG